ncbi:MAG: hypothetical protein ACKOVA_14735 [Novosphingobium sp.]
MSSTHLTAPTRLINSIIGRRNTLGIADLHVVEGATGGMRVVVPSDCGALPRRFKRACLANNGDDLEFAAAQLAADQADLSAFGRRGAKPLYLRRNLI